MSDAYSEELRALATELAEAVLAEVGPVAAVGVTQQRATTVLWDARSGEPVGPALGWQDLRTVGRCLQLRAEGLVVAPNQTATKLEWLLQHTDTASADLRAGTLDAWLAWHLTGGRHHVTDASNASVTGLADPGSTGWDPATCAALGIPVDVLPAIVDSGGVIGETVLPGRPPLAALVGDQQASLVGQGCVEPGAAKVTFGTGAMLDVCLGADPGPPPGRGTFPMVGWRLTGATTWAREAVMLAAGSSVEWLRDGLGIVDDPADTDVLAASVRDTGGVVFVPSLSGTGTPDWDHGARGLLIGLTRGTTRAHVARAVLEGVAARGVDLVDAAERDTGVRIERLRVDGGMSRNRAFVQALADLAGRPVEVAGVTEATALGAAHLAGTAVGTWPDLASAVATRPPGWAVEPLCTRDRAPFAEARRRAGGWIPELSALDL